MNAAGQREAQRADRLAAAPGVAAPASPAPPGAER